MKQPTRKNKPLSDQEKAAVYYGVFHNLKILDIYKIAHPDKTTTSPNTAQSWLKSDRVRPYLDAVKIQKADFERRAEEERKTKTKIQESTEQINFTDREEFIKYLNRAANSVTDDKQKADYLKMLADLQQFKKDETTKDNNEIQRFYTPVTCTNCLLYQKQKELL